MRHKVIEVRQEVFNHNEHEVSKRWAFEEGVGLVFFPLLMFYSFSPPPPHYYQTNKFVFL